MRTLLISLAAGAALLAPIAAQAAPGTPEAQLAEATAGRTAQAPVGCINLRDIDSSRIIDGTAIVYRMMDGTVYVNRPSGASFLRSDAVLVTDTHSPQLCSVDIVRLYDSSAHMSMGSVGLGPFVPYPRPADKRPG